MKKFLVFMMIVAVMFCAMTAHVANGTVLKNENLGVYTQTTYSHVFPNAIVRTVDVYNIKTGDHTMNNEIITYSQFFAEMKVV